MFYVSYDKDIKERVFYLKGETNHTYTLTVTGEPIVASGDPLILTGTLTDENGNVVVGQPIEVIRANHHNHYITDANGQVKYTYTGTSTSQQITVLFKFKSFVQTSATFHDGTVYGMSLSASSTSIVYGNSSTITATLTADGSPLSGKTVKFTSGGSTLGTSTTNSSGQAQYTYVSTSIGTVSITGAWNNVSDNISITVNKKPTTVSLSASSTSIDVGTAPSLSGTLLDGSSGITGATIKIYKNNSQIGTATTTTGGAFTYTDTAPSVSGSLSYKAVYDGTSIYENSESSAVSVTVNKLNTTLVIDVPLSLVYSDAFNITGTLKDANNNVLKSKSVKLKVGSTVVDTQTTNNNGVVSFTQTPVSMGTHTFQLLFETDSAYNTSSSSAVTREIGKETSVLTLTTPLNNTSIYADGTVSISGTLLSNDGEAISGKSIVVSESGTTLTTLTTGSNGAFSGSLSGLSIATHTLKFEFVADTNYTGSNVTRSVVVNSPTLVLSSTTPVIQSGGSATVTATYTATNKASKPLYYTLMHGSTHLSSGAVTTNSNGVATISYTGNGVGNVDVVVSDGSLLQETYELIDAIYYDNATSDQSSNYYFNPSGGTTLTYSNGYYVLGLGTSGNYVQLGSLTDNVKGTTLNFDVDLVLDGASTRTEVYVDNTRVAYSSHSTTNGTLSIQNVIIPSNATSVIFRISRRYTNDGNSIKFKNFKVYPSDCIAYDKGTTSDHNDIWELSNCSLTRSSDYTTLKETSSANGNAYLSIPNPCKIEFDIYQVDGELNNFFLNFWNSGKTYRGGTGLGHTSGSLNTWNSIEITLNGAIAVVKNKTTGTNNTRYLSDSDVTLMSFFGGGGITELRFKNFKTYLITDCIAYDKGTTSDHNDIWYLTNATMTRNAEYTTILSSAQWGTAQLTGSPSQSTPINLLENNNIVCIEFDAIGTHRPSLQGFNIRYNDGTYRYLGCSNGEGHTLVYISNTQFLLIVEGVVKANYTNMNIPNANLQSVADASNLEVKFANLKIYPVDSIPI